MALPTVVFDSIPAGTDSSLISEFMPRLHALLLAAGWTLEYADATAIGGGSSGTPAWDATPTLNTSAGRVIYSMPLNEHTRDWHVQIECGWGSNASNNHRFSVTIGTGWDNISALTNAGSTFTYENNYSFGPNTQTLMSASEDGFAWYSPATVATSPRWVLVERPRDFESVNPGNVSDDLIICGFAQGGTFLNQAPAYGSARYRASDGLEYATSGWAGLAISHNMTTWQGPSVGTFTSSDGQHGAPIGPFPLSGKISGLPRLLLLLQQPDVLPNTDHPVLVDGGVKLYRTPAALLAGTYTPILATE